jgi:hypothetical protein
MKILVNNNNRAKITIKYIINRIILYNHKILNNKSNSYNLIIINSWIRNFYKIKIIFNNRTNFKIWVRLTIKINWFNKT